MLLAIGLLEMLKPSDCHIGHMSQIMLNAFDVGFHLCHELVGLILIIFKDTLHLDLQEAQIVVVTNLTDELRLPWGELRVEELQHGFLVRSLLKIFLLVHPFFDEDPFQGSEEELFLQFALTDLQLLAQQSHRAVRGVLQHLGDGEELRFVILDDTTVG